MPSPISDIDEPFLIPGSCPCACQNYWDATYGLISDI